jgi:hypothetical protein
VNDQKQWLRRKEGRKGGSSNLRMSIDTGSCIRFNENENENESDTSLSSP